MTDTLPKPLLKPYKFQIVAVCQQETDGKVVGEQIVAGAEGQPMVVFGIDGLRAFAEGFEAQLEALSSD